MPKDGRLTIGVLPNDSEGFSVDKWRRRPVLFSGLAPGFAGLLEAGAQV